MKKLILIPALLGVMGIGGLITFTEGNLVGSASELTIEQIKEKALSEVDGTISKVEVKNEGNRKYYEIEVFTEDAEYDMSFDVITGELIKKHNDVLDDQKSNTNINQNITIQPSPKQILKTEQIQTNTKPAPKSVRNTDDDIGDDDYNDRYDGYHDNDYDDNDDDDIE